jgi:acetyl-CoA acetyltransferase
VTAAIAGIGQTRFARRAGTTEAALAAQAIARALADARLRPQDVDGVVRFDREAMWEFDLPGILGMPNLSWYAAVPYGPGSAPALVRLAAMAVEQGLARTVIAYHARNGAERAAAAPPAVLPGVEQMQLPFGLATPAQAAALVLRRRVDAAAIAAATRAAHAAAAKNPRALVRRALDARTHTASPCVAEPFRRVDCAEPAVGGCAFVVTARDAARGRHRPARVLATMQAAVPSATRFAGEWVRADAPAVIARAAKAMFRAARLRPAAVDVACLYDDPSGLVPLAQRVFGLKTARVNPHGGQLGEAALDGINDVLEAVRQLRGDAARPVRGARVALVAGSLLEPTSAALFGR